MNRQNILAVCAVLLIAVVGTILLIRSHALTPTTNFEAENGTLSGGCPSILSDSTASNGKALEFNACSSGGGSAPYAGAGASLPISYSLSSLTGTVVYVATNGSDSNSGSVSSPYATLAKAISAAPSGGTIVVRGGTYRNQANLSISKTLKIIAYPGETPVFNGAAAVSSTSGWTVSGSLSYRSYTPMPVTDGSGISFTTCANQSSSCLGKYPDQVWVGTTQYQQVGSQSAVTTGKFWVDSTNDRLYMLTTDVNKGGVEISSQRKFATVAAPNVTLEGFKVIRYSNTASDYGVISFNGLADNSLMQDMFISDTAFIAVNYSPNGTTNLNEHSTVKDSTIQYSNWMGVSALATNYLTFDHDNISNMNQFGEFATLPQSGSIKTSRTWYTTVKNSIISNDKSKGMWFDQSNYMVVVANNDIENNSDSGIFFEISDFVYAINNYMKIPSGVIGIKTAGSSDVFLVNNTVVGGAPSFIVATDARSLAGCSTNATNPCGHNSSDVDQYHTHVATLTWIPSIDLVLNNILTYPSGVNNCSQAVTFCITQHNATALIPLNQIIHPADPTYNVPQTLIDGNIYANGTGAVIGVKNESDVTTNYATGTSFATAMAGSPVNISGFEVHGHTGNQYVNTDGTPTSTLSALFGNALAIPTDSTINPYVAAGTKHYGVTWQ